LRSEGSFRPLLPPEATADQMRQEPAIWKVVYAANELRNKTAHTFELTKIKAKMDALRAVYLAALTPTQRIGGAGPSGLVPMRSRHARGET
jgi:hypothetical protein